MAKKPKQKPAKPGKAMKAAILAKRIKAVEDAGRKPRTLWQQAKADPNHILHKEFDWDVQRSAEREWDRRAAELIREVKAFVTYEDRVIAVPYYVSDPSTDESLYTTTARVAKSGTMSQHVLKRELAGIKAAINRALGLAMAFNLKSSFERMLDEVVRIESRLAEFESSEDEARV
jgi:hypothetical protein